MAQQLPQTLKGHGGIQQIGSKGVSQTVQTVAAVLQEMKNVSVGIKRLSLGDYLVDNRLIFERKTLNDFALSIIDGRLFSQAIRLASSKYNNVLLLEGTGKELTETGIRDLEANLSFWIDEYRFRMGGRHEERDQDKT